MAVVGVEEDQVAGKIWIHELEGEGSCQGRKESSPHDLVWEIVRHLQRDKDGNELCRQYVCHTKEGGGEGGGGKGTGIYIPLFPPMAPSP